MMSMLHLAQEANPERVLSPVCTLQTLNFLGACPLPTYAFPCLFFFFTVYVGGLGLAGVELTFFIAASTVLWFGFMAPTMLVAHQCSE